MRGLSIVVCCYNSVHRLSPLLSHLRAQQFTSPFPWEIILVDNASTDGTDSAAAAIWSEYRSGIPLRVIKEVNPGLSHARKAGVLAASFGYVLFCDDDNWLAPDYAENAFRLMEQMPDVGVLGGKGIPVFETSAPDWFKDFEYSYAVGAQRAGSGYMPHGAIIYGAGMVIRKAPLIRLFELGFKGFLSDRKGKDLVSGGDNELCWWFARMNYRLYYDEMLTFHHFIPSGRLTVEYLLARNAAKGKTEAILYVYDELSKGASAAAWVDSIYLWYWQVLKRCGYIVVYTLRGARSLRDKLIRKMLQSSVRTRLSTRAEIMSAKKGIVSLMQKLEVHRG